jgi:hypothetical protein
MIKYILVNSDKTISVISETNKPNHIEIDLTQKQYEDILKGVYLYDNGLIENPDYEPSIVITTTDVEEQLNRRKFGQEVIATFQVEFKVEELLQTDFQSLQLTIERTKSLFDALNNGWLGMAILVIKSTQQINLTPIITADVLTRYRNKIHDYLGLDRVINYND